MVALAASAVWDSALALFQTRILRPRNRPLSVCPMTSIQFPLFSPEPGPLGSCGCSAWTGEGGFLLLALTSGSSFPSPSSSLAGARSPCHLLGGLPQCSLPATSSFGGRSLTWPSVTTFPPPASSQSPSPASVLCASVSLPIPLPLSLPSRYFLLLPPSWFFFLSKGQIFVFGSWVPFLPLCSVSPWASVFIFL